MFTITMVKGQIRIYIIAVIFSVYNVSSLSYFIVNICVYLLYIISIETTVHGSSTQSRSFKDSCVLEVLYTDNCSIHYTDSVLQFTESGVNISPFTRDNYTHSSSSLSIYCQFFTRITFTIIHVHPAIQGLSVCNKYFITSVIIGTLTSF